MISLAARIALAASLLATASAGASPAPPLLSLSASPARVKLLGTARETIGLTNYGAGRAVLDVALAGFALDLRGRPRIVARGRRPRATSSWLMVRPRRLALRPGSTASMTVSSLVPHRAEPGDHYALVLLTTRPLPGARLSLRMRIGIVVVVRVPGAIVRRLELRSLRVRRAGRIRLLELSVANRGNVTEELQRGRVDVSLLRHGRVLARLRPVPREVLPGASGIAEIRYRGRLRGSLTALVEVRPREPGGSATRRTFRIRL